MYNRSSNPRPMHPIARRAILASIGLVVSTLFGFGLANAIPQMRYEEQGPRPITEAELLKLRDGDELPEGLLALDATSLTDTGIVKKEGNVVARRYMLVTVGNRRVFAVAPYNHAGNRLIGYLRVMDPTDRFHRDGLSGLDYEARDKVMNKFPDRTLAPYYFEVTGGRRTGWVGVAIFGVLTLIGVSLILVALFGRM